MRLKPLPVSIYKKRIKKLQEKLQAEDIDLFVGYSSECESATSRFLTGFWPFFDFTAVLVPAQGNAALITGGPESYEFAKSFAQSVDIYINPLLVETSAPDWVTDAPGEDFSQIIAKVCASVPGRIGLGNHNIFPFNLLEDLKKACPSSEIVPADNLLWEVQAIKEDEEIPYIYGVDEHGRLTGVIRLADLLRAHPQETLQSIAKAQIVSIGADQDQELAARILNRYDLMALPVVDEEGRILGVITADDAMEVLEEETTEDIYKRAGILAAKVKDGPKTDILVRGPVWRSWAVRAPFLLITMAGGMMAGAVIEMFSDLLEAVVILALFIPVIMDMGGNAGLQSTSIFIRGYVLGHIDPYEIGKHILREIAIGLGMGVLLGLIVGVLAMLWQGIPAIGLVVGISLTLTIIIATFLGFVIPFSLTKMGIDPAAGSGPLITTIKDITGLFIYFGTATLLLTHLI